MSYKRLFSRSLSSAPDRLHFASHSHHLWPDAAFEGHEAAAKDAATYADHKWRKVFSEIIPATHAEIASELHLPSTDSLTFATNTHEFLVRMASCFPKDQPLRIVTTDGEFHSLSRQLKRWEEAGQALATRVPVEPFDTFTERFLETVHSNAADWVFLSHVFFGSGHVAEGLAEMAELLSDRPEWLILDGYHSFMAIDADLSPIADRAFYLSGAYKYAMAGEGACFLHAPKGYGERPVNTGWFAAFDALSNPQDNTVPYAENANRFAGATFDPSGYYRLLAVRRMLHTEGLTTQFINQHIRPLQDQFLNLIQTGKAGGLTEARLMAQMDKDHRARFLAFHHPNASKWEVALSEAGVIVDVRVDIIRFGFGLYHDPEDVDQLASICQTVLN